MEPNPYMVNRHKLLLMIKELHQRGYEKLRVIPSVAPSGLYWRCTLTDGTRENCLIVSNWICKHEQRDSSEDPEEIGLNPQELADLFSRENAEFIACCKGENKEYVKWYDEMLGQLKKGELPYAFADYFSPTDHWETSEKNKIKTLPNEKRYYF